MLKLARYLQGLKTVPTSKTNNTVQSMNNNNNNDNDKSNFSFILGLVESGCQF